MNAPSLHQPGSYRIAAASHPSLKINRTAHNGRSPWQILVDCYYERPSVFLELHNADTLMTSKNMNDKPTTIHLFSH